MCAQDQAAHQILLTAQIWLFPPTLGKEHILCASSVAITTLEKICSTYGSRKLIIKKSGARAQNSITQECETTVIHKSENAKNQKTSKHNSENNERTQRTTNAEKHPEKQFEQQ
jgi:hypothetical protein